MEPSEVETWSSARQASYHRNGMEQAIRKAAEEAEIAYRREHPQAGSLRTKSEIIVYRKPPPGFYNHAKDLVEQLLVSRVALQQSNAQLAAQLSIKFSPHPVAANLLTRPLTPGPIKQISKVLSGAGIWLDLRKHNTLSKIKLALRAKMENPSTARSYMLPIEFHATSVVVGNVRLPASKHEKGYQRIRLGSQWLRCDVLEELARKGTD